MDKSPDAFRTISEVAEVLETPAHVLRFWESRFPQIRPVKRAGGRRYYRPSDVALLVGIKRLLHDEGLTIRGVQKLLRDHGVRNVAGLSDDSVLVGDLVTPALPHLPAANPVPESGLVAAPTSESAAPNLASEEVPEAGFIAVEDEDEDALPLTPPSVVQPPRPPAAPVPDTLPLFAAAAQADPAAPPARVLTLSDNMTFAKLIRTLPPETRIASRPEVSALASRLAALRDLMAGRAEGVQD